MSLLVIFVLVFVLEEFTGGVRSPLLAATAQVNQLVEAGEWWRVISATLLHAGLAHLFFNSYALYVLGPHLERQVGSLPFAALYGASGLAGGVAFLWFAPGETAVGASGAIFGLFGAWLAAAYANRHTVAGRAGFRQFMFLLAINLALPLFVEGIAWQAHLGGLVVGVATGLWWSANRRRGVTQPAPQSALPLTVAALLLLSLIA